MECNGCPAVNSEKTIFIKRQGSDFIFHCLFVDNIMHVSPSEALCKEFMDKYIADFNITAGSIMETFLSMEVQQTKPGIKLHLDHYIQEPLYEYKAFIKKSLRPKKVQI
jgi:hypothetical protein